MAVSRLRTRVDGAAAYDYVARSFETGSRSQSDEPIPPERSTKASRRVFAFRGPVSDLRNQDPNRGAPAKRHTPPKRE